MKAIVAILILATGLGFGGTAAADYQDGLDAVKRGDYATALQELRPLAEQGHAVAQALVGAAYSEGLGVAKNDKEAVKWYRLAAEQGLAFAQSNLGIIYASGTGVLQNYVEAVKWFRKAAEQGDAKAQFKLGVFYALGSGGLPTDIELSYMWLNIAAANGDETSVEYRDMRDTTSNYLTSAQIEKAQNMARRCMESDYKDC
jgi:uncharacterized protein